MTIELTEAQYERLVAILRYALKTYSTRSGNSADETTIDAITELIDLLDDI